MALPYPEGEVYFKRSVLHHDPSGWTVNEAKGTDWTDKDKAAFYGHALVEYVWNRPFYMHDWAKHPDPRASTNSPPTQSHPRCSRITDKVAGWWTDEYWWDKTCILFTDRDGTTVRRKHEIHNCPNAWQYKDWQAGGPSKVCIKPIPLGDEPLMFIDLTLPIRAIYFPVAHQSDEAFEDLTTYLMIDFRLRKSVHIISATSYTSVDWTCDTTIGLGFHWDYSLRVDIAGVYTTLGLPRQLRNPDYTLFLAPADTPIMVVSMSDISNTSTLTGFPWDDQMDLAALISGNFGVELTWRPYEPNHWLANLARNLIEFGLGLIPVAGPILSIGFTIAWTAITDPETFASDDVLDLGASLMEAFLESGKQYRKHVADGFDVSEIPTRSLVRPSAGPGSGEASARTTKALKEQYANGLLGPSPSFAARLPDQSTVRLFDDDGNYIGPEAEGNPEADGNPDGEST